MNVSMRFQVNEHHICIISIRFRFRLDGQSIEITTNDVDLSSLTLYGTPSNHCSLDIPVHFFKTCEDVRKCVAHFFALCALTFYMYSLTEATVSSITKPATR